MAIAFARARYISRATGGSATRSAAYNARETIADERTGKSYSFAHRDKPDHHEVLLPEGADARFGDSVMLWNAAERAERRYDAQVAREIVIALPANAELTDEDRLALVRSFAQEHFVRHGLAVQLDIHTPHDGDTASEVANIHAHLLITTRRVEGNALSVKKARDLDPQVRQFGTRPGVTEADAWGALWREHQDRYFIENGLDIRVDAPNAVPQAHVGPIRMRVPESEAVARAEELARENAIAARDPDRVLAVLTRNNATFTERDLDRHLAKHIHDEAEHLAIKARVLGHADTLALRDRDTGDVIGRYTTRTVRSQENGALNDADAMLRRARHRHVRAGARSAALADRTLRPDQRKAFDHAVAAGDLKIIEGRAGTGKSYTLAAVRDAHARAGYDVVGLAPTNTVAQDLKADGFTQAGTVHAELFRLKNGRTAWTDQTLVIVDEAAMLDTGVMAGLLAEARSSGAKLILAGDDRQLASIERGGLFTELRQRHGSAEIVEVTRQKVDWQRTAARDMAEGRVGEALEAFARHKALDWSATQEEARGRLVARWATDATSATAPTRFVFAYTNKDVDALNAALRSVRVERGEIEAGTIFDTRHGAVPFAVGDRVQFTDTVKRDRIYNGNVGVVTAIDPLTGKMSARIDGDGRSVTWQPAYFDGFRHGYAGTIYKGQGKTLDHTYLYHSEHWRQASSYVALTRQRESAMIFAATETARDISALSRQMGRTEVRAASVAWATIDELSPALRPTRPATVVDTSDIARPAADPTEEPRAAMPRSIPASNGVDATAPAPREWLIVPRVTERRIDTAEAAAAVAADQTVLRERQALKQYLAGAFERPDTAEARLAEIVRRDGPTSAARRIAADPAQLGELLGRTGLLAGQAARDERARAQTVAAAIGPAVARIGEAKAAAAAGYRRRAEARWEADATGIPLLSDETRKSLAQVAAAHDDRARAVRWQDIRNDPRAADEIERFMKAAERRFGNDAVRVLERTGKISGASMGAGDHGALREVAETVRTVRSAERAATSEARRIVAAQRAGQRRTIR